MKDAIRPMYWAMKGLFYPLVILFGLVPPLRERPYHVVGVYTLFLFGFVGSRVGVDTLPGAITFVVIQTAGFLLMLAFIVWGSEYERHRRRVE